MIIIYVGVVCVYVCVYLNTDKPLERMERKLFLREEYQLINVEEMREPENHHFATTNVITDSGKNHQTIE